MSVVASDPQLGTGHPVGREGAAVDIVERRAWQANGFLGLLIAVLLTGGAIAGFATAESTDNALAAVLGVVAAFAATLVYGSLSVVQPGRTKVVQFFGRYVGTVRRAGLVWVMPLSSRKTLSVRVRNFETGHMKVNDSTGNPVEIAAIVVWQVADTARATFAVEEYEQFVTVQSESAVRHVAGAYPYDAAEGEESLRGSTDQVSLELAHEVAARVSVAGVEIVEVRISHLAYAPEIAQAMLQRQQANAVVAARSRIVEGAVGMVKSALEQLREEDVVELDDERKAAMVSNLLVVLCGESRATPVVNAGTLYQ